MTTIKSKTRKNKPAPATTLGDALTSQQKTALASALSANPTLPQPADIREIIDPPAVHSVGETVFDVIEGFGSQGQTNAWRSIGNTALATALYAANNVYALQKDQYADDENIRAQQYRASLYSDLYAHAVAECGMLSDSKYDQPMSVTGMFDLLTSGEPQPQDRDEAVFEATLTAMEVTGVEAAALRETRKKALHDRAIKQQLTMKNRRAEVIDEVERGSPFFNSDRFTAPQHLAFFKKVFANLRKAAMKALTYTGQYEDATSDAIAFNADAKIVDKAMVAFRRRNREDLALTESRSVD